VGRKRLRTKARAKKQQKQKRKEFSNVFAFYILLHLLTTDNCPLTTVFQQAVARNMGKTVKPGVFEMVKKKKGKKFWAIVAILILVPVIGLILNQSAKQRMADIPLVETSVIERGNLSSNIYTSGTIRAKNSVSVLADISGRISEVNYKDGDILAKGDIVASFERDELFYAFKEAELNLALSKRREEAELASAKRAYENAREDFDRNSLLYSEGAVSKLQYDDSRRLFLDLRDEFEKVKELSGKRIELEKLRIEKLGEDLEKTKVIAPADGTVTNMQIEPGGFVALNQPLFKIQDFDQMEVLTQISEYDISSLEKGQEVLVRAQGRDEDFEGRITSIAPDAKLLSNGQGSETVVEVVVEITERTDAFKPNFSAELQILTGSIEDALLVPYEAVYTKKDGEKLVYLISDENRVKETPIKAGMEGDLLTEIIPLDGSNPENEKVVLNPRENLKDGMAVRIKSGKEEEKQ